MRDGHRNRRAVGFPARDGMRRDARRDRRRDATRDGRRSVAAAALALGAALACGACNLPLREVGHAPEGPVRDYPADIAASPDARRAAARRAAAEAARDAAETQSDPDPVRWGDPATRWFHRANCGDVERVPAESRVRFETYWGAVDAQYAPCPRCSPEPR